MFVRLLSRERPSLACSLASRSHEDRRVVNRRRAEMRTKCPLNDRCFRFSVNLSNLFRSYVELRENGVNAEVLRPPAPGGDAQNVIEESQSRWASPGRRLPYLPRSRRI